MSETVEADAVDEDGFAVGDPGMVYLTIDIECDGCERLIYRKEIQTWPDRV